MPNATEKEMPMNALLGMEFKILGSNLAAIYEKGTNGYKMLVVPVNQKNNTGITISELLDDIAGLMGQTTEKGKINENELTQNLKAALPKTIKIEEILIKLKTAYLYVNAAGGQPAKVEYAFSLDVITDGVLPEGIKLVDVKKLSVSVWNTDREKILQLMTLQGIDTYLEG